MRFASLPFTSKRWAWPVVFSTSAARSSLNHSWPLEYPDVSVLVLMIPNEIRRRRVNDSVAIQPALALAAIHANPLDLPLTEASRHRRPLSSNSEERLDRRIVAPRDHQFDHFAERETTLPGPATGDIANARYDISRQHLDLLLQAELPFIHQCEHMYRDR